MSNYKLKASDLYFSYEDEKGVINNISFGIKKGESVGIIGANGAGKSTLLMMLLGVLFPSKGEIIVDGVLLNKKNIAKIREKIGMVFQDSDDQLFMPTVYDDVAFGPRNYKIEEKEIENRVNKALEEVGILHLKDRAPFKLSGGEKRCAAIATVLSMVPEILVLDEPTTALDPKSRRRIINLLDSFPHTKIVTSHDLDMVLETCERIIVIRAGKIIKDGPSKMILCDKKLLESCGLELPLSVSKCLICSKE